MLFRSGCPGGYGNCSRDDVPEPMAYFDEMGPYHLSDPLDDDYEEDAQLVSKRWMDLDTIIEHTSGPSSWSNAPCTAAIDQFSGLNKRVWCAYQACIDLAKQNDGVSDVLDVDLEEGEWRMHNGQLFSQSSSLRTSLAYVVLAANLIKLRASVLKCHGSYVA